MNWSDFIEQEMGKDYFRRLSNFLSAERKAHQVFPPRNQVFAAFDACAFEDVRCVILGQDPYFRKGQAMGLSFSVPDGETIPPSLRNIYKEMRSDLGYEPPKSGNLSKWAERGVLLLNTALTVRAGEANSHKGKGWETFTDSAISLINEKRSGIVFILWGSNAREKKRLITNKSHLVLESVHPSPLSAAGGFFGTQPFSQTNLFLESKGHKPINWNLSE